MLGRLDALLSEEQRRSSPEELGRYRLAVGAVLFLLAVDVSLVVTAPLFPASRARMGWALSALDLEGRIVTINSAARRLFQEAFGRAPRAGDTLDAWSSSERRAEWREHLAQLFVHGFTTKKDGHGFGLHASALAAEELDGRLSCTSGGPGQGATFIIELPLRGQEARA